MISCIFQKIFVAHLFQIKIISNLLEGKEFCVLTGTPELTKPEIEKKIIENGGAVVQNAGIGQLFK